MPFTLAHSDRLRRHPPLVPSRSSSASSHDASPLGTDTSPATTERQSLCSFVSSSEHTAVSDYPNLLSHQRPHFLDDGASSIYKTLPAVPSWGNAMFNHKAGRRSDDYDHHSFLYTSEPATLTSNHPLTSITQLVSALGPDNVPHTTEIATIPCTGVRIAHGPLTGLLAWRLVVSNPVPIKSPSRSWWGKGDPTRQKGGYRHESHKPLLTKRSSSDSEFAHTEMKQPKVWAATSTISLPMKGGTAGHISHIDGYHHIPVRPQSAMTVFSLPHYPAEEKEFTQQQSQNMHPSQTSPAVATNFILDTSLPYSIISRDTLVALGYSSDRFPTPHADPHALEYDDTEESRNSELIVSLSIQGVTTRIRIARPGEASRLGVQYLRDASVSVFFPKDGGGVGPVLYYESALLLRDIPLTITALPGHGGGGKLSLPQRVRALFGLS